MNNAREELARTLSAAYGSQDWMITPVDRNAAKSLIDAGYRIPKILGYAVVDERDTPLMVNFAARKAAEEYALENTGRMNHQYRVAEIVEPRA